MKSNSVFLVFAATIIIAGILLARLFANAPTKMADSVEKKTEQALATTPAPGATPADATATATPTPSPSQSPTPTPAPAAAKAVPSAASVVSAPVDAKLESEFLAVSTSALQAIPSQDQVRKLKTPQIHFTPKQVIEAADEIGRVAEMVQAHPELSTRGLEFYKQCAEKESSVESIRATCFSDFKTLRKRAGSGAATPKVPERIAALAEKLSS